MKIAILAGGGGTRLFPLSRTSYPKQFLKLDGEYSLLAQTVRRFFEIVPPEDILVITNAQHFHNVKSDLAQAGASNAKILLEPVGRNTAPAIALAAIYCKAELKANDDEVIFVAPADHVIKDLDYFTSIAQKGASLASKGYIVTFGIRPIKPETGFGYIQSGAPVENGFFVKSFKEKPDEETAAAYLKSGDYYWNSGMFACRMDTFRNELRRYAENIYNFMDKPYAEVLENFADMPNISIDYALAEKSDKVALIPYDGDWSDVGSWDAIYDLAVKNNFGNAVMGDCITVDCKNSLFLGKNRMIAGVGLEDTIVVETDDAILVTKRGESQKVKEIVDILKKQGRKEASEHLTVNRPWGNYTILGEGSNYKMKRIVVNPGSAISLQLHYHRSEHWVVIEGTAKVTLSDSIKMVHTGESVFIPASAKHRLENPGKIPLKIIEVQNGSYLEEDDIVRFEDSYGRC